MPWEAIAATESYVWSPVVEHTNTNVGITVPKHIQGLIRYFEVVAFN